MRLGRARNLAIKILFEEFPNWDKSVYFTLAFTCRDNIFYDTNEVTGYTSETEGPCKSPFQCDARSIQLLGYDG